MLPQNGLESPGPGSFKYTKTHSLVTFVQPVEKNENNGIKDEMKNGKIDGNEERDREGKKGETTNFSRKISTEGNSSTNIIF